MLPQWRVRNEPLVVLRSCDNNDIKTLTQCLVLNNDGLSKVLQMSKFSAELLKLLKKLYCSNLSQVSQNTDRHVLVSFTSVADSSSHSWKDHVFSISDVTAKIVPNRSLLRSEDNSNGAGSRTVPNSPASLSRC